VDSLSSLAMLRFFPDDVSTLSLLPIIGWFEIALGVLVLVRPSAELLLFVFVWKVFAEMLRPFSGEPFWEFIERFGSYSAALALFLVLLAQRSVKSPQNSSQRRCSNVADEHSDPHPAGRKSRVSAPVKSST
jgi:hypothetical protein